MGLSPGQRLGAYEVISAIGAGGMGEVYRARHTKPGRDVALKLLPDTFRHEPDRVARFQREAQFLAALNHPSIAAIYGLEEASGSQFLVLELVEGETLASRIARGPVPLAEALVVARQVISALEAAHEKGIIHRDLKPANIAFASNGQVKVLDFGLAKVMEPTSGAIDISHSPTLTFNATRAGVILGTAAYMSPEQAKGRVADKRSDVWAFGCVLYEMLTGKRAFEGEDVSDTLAAILRGEPDWTALPSDVPAPLRTVVKRCLEKDRLARIPDLSVVRFLMDDASVGAEAGQAASAIAGAQGAAARRATPWIAWALAGALGVGLAAVVVLWSPWRTASPRLPLRLSAELGADASLVTTFGSSAIPSPDGQTLAFIAQKGASVPQLYIRRLDQLQATALSGTDAAASPFFSPDGQWIAFFATGRLKKIAVTGGAAVSLCDAPSGRGGTWTPDGSIIFTPTSTGGLFRVSSAGGRPEPLTALTEDETTHRWPQILPGGKAVLYSAGVAGRTDDSNLVVQPLPKGDRKIVQRGLYGRYLPSGHLVYVHEGTLFAQLFDIGRLETTGQAAPAVEGVIANAGTSGAQFAVSDEGVLVYVSGQLVGNDAPMSWMDRSGKLTPLRTTPANWSNPSISPDGRKLAIDISDGRQTDVWVYEWERDTLSRLTFDPGDDQRPVWTPDGRRIAFASKRGNDAASNLYWQLADGTGEVQRLTTSKNVQQPGSWHPSGKFLAFQEQNPQTGADLMSLTLDGSDATGWKPGTPTVFLTTPFLEGSPMFSPDGKWIAYLSNESGRNEVYVRPFPGPGGKWQVSTGAADDPTWSRKRPELFFATQELRMMVATYSNEVGSFRVDKPTVWSEGRFTARPRPPSRDLDIHPDGERFVVAPGTDQTASKQDKVVFIFNFFDELRRVAPVSKR